MIIINNERNLCDSNSKAGLQRRWNGTLLLVWTLEHFFKILNVPSESSWTHCVVSSSIGQTTWILYFTARGFFIYQQRGCNEPLRDPLGGSRDDYWKKSVISGNENRNQNCNVLRLEPCPSDLTTFFIPIWFNKLNSPNCFLRGRPK